MTVFKLQDIVVRCDRERFFGFIRALVIIIIVIFLNIGVSHRQKVIFMHLWNSIAQRY